VPSVSQRTRTVGIDRVLFKVAESLVKIIGESLHDKNKVVFWSTIYYNIHEEEDFLCWLTIGTPFRTIVIFVPWVQLKIIMKGDYIIFINIPIRQCCLARDPLRCNRYTRQFHIHCHHIQF